MITKPEFIARPAAQDRAVIHNWVGYQLFRLTGGNSMLEPRVLYEQAIGQYLAAMREVPTWYLPYENDADVTSYLGEVTHDRDKQYEAIRLYDQALALASHREGYLDEADWEQLAPGTIVQLNVSKAIAQLLTDDESVIETVLGQAQNWARGGPVETQDPLVNYTVGCFFARVSHLFARRERPEDARRSRAQAVFALANAFAGRPELAAHAASDPDLEPIRNVVRRLAAADWATISGLSGPERYARIDREISDALREPETAR